MKDEKSIENSPLIISGPSGVGKTYLVSILTKDYPFKNVISTTTRDIRLEETHNVDYQFLTEAQYDEVQESGDFFMDNSFFKARYGYRRSVMEAIVNSGFIPTAILHTRTTSQFVKEYPNSHGIFLIPRSISLLRKRMLERGDKPESVNHRIDEVEKEVQYYREIANGYYTKCFEIEKDEDSKAVISHVLAHYCLLK